jgi:polyhydroxybutyrate depolymerase
MKLLSAFAAIPLVLLTAGTGLAQTAAGHGYQTIQSAGVERSYLLHVPPDYDGDAIPLVLNFHGSGGVPENQLATSGFDVLADREGFAVAFPAGVFTNSVSSRSWNANVEEGVDDVRFARDVIADVSARINVDPARIYVTGMSGGARMSSRLACELSDVLAAAAPVAGLQYPDGCVPVRAMPIISFHGKADRVNQYEVSADSRPYWRMGVETAAEKWRQANHCKADMQVSEINDNVELRTWSACDSGSEIRLYVIEDGGHVWPDDASEKIWSFFEGHPRSR